MRSTTGALLSCLWFLLVPAVTLAQTEGRASIVGGRTDYTVVRDDTLTAIAAKYGVTPESIAALNGVALRARLEPGRTLAIDNPHIAVSAPGTPLTINIAQRMLVFVDGGHVAAYPITVGRRDWPTPTGAFTILRKEIDPTWDVPVSIQREMAS